MDSGLFLWIWILKSRQLEAWKSVNSKKVFQWSLKKKKINLRCYNLICIDVAGTVQNQVKNYRDQKISLFSHLN